MNTGNVYRMPLPAPACLSDDELYNYLTRKRGRRSFGELELHLAECGNCRRELAQLIEILHPEEAAESEPLPEMSPEMLHATLELVKGSGESAPVHAVSWVSRHKRLLPVAASLVLVSLGSWGIGKVLQNRRAGEYFDSGVATLQEVYAPQSPGGLRLSMPFQAAARLRATGGEDDILQNAERQFYQALTLREDLEEAHLGLGYVYLRKAGFSKAQAEFDAVLRSHPDDLRALIGRGTTAFEQGMASKNPLERRACMDVALADFSRSLELFPGSTEAAYNRAVTLYELGRHREALKQIETYLQLDSNSLWSEKLRNYQTRMRLTQEEAVLKEVEGAALRRDSGALERLVSLVAYQIPKAIRVTMRKSLQQDGVLTPGGGPDTASYEWAARVLETAYSDATGDHSYKRLFRFYADLSPPQRNLKRSLDARFQKLVELHKNNQIAAAIAGSESLLKPYQDLHDDWQLSDLHHLRGNCFYYKQYDLARALPEYNKSLASAERSQCSELVVIALGCIGVVYTNREQFDPAIDTYVRMKALAERFGQLPWLAYAAKNLGSIYFTLNQTSDSLREYSTAVALSRRLMDDDSLRATLRGLSLVAEKLDRIPEARRFLEEARYYRENLLVEGSRQTQYTALVEDLNALHREGALALRMGDLSTAEDRFRTGMESARENEYPELESRNHLGLAQVFLDKGDVAVAQNEARLCLARSANNVYPVLEWQAERLLGLIAKTAGNGVAALEHLQRSVDVIEHARRGISSADMRQAFLTRRYEPYQETVSLLQQLGRPAEALRYVERAKSMTLREALSKLQRTTGKQAAEAAWPAVPVAGSDLPADTAILEYFVTSSETLLFLSSKTGLQTFSAGIPAREMGELVQKYLAGLKGDDAPATDIYARRLYDLLEPAMVALTGHMPGSLVILPDGPLHNLPFAALKDSQGRHLIEKLPVSYAPSRSVLAACLGLSRKHRDVPNSGVLLLDGTANLQGGSSELVAMKRLFGGGARLFDGADSAALADAVKDAGIIHFSGHAQLQHGRPVLLLSSGNGNLAVDPWAIREMNLASARLVTLAGCSTGIGPQNDGEVPWGLLPALLTAGAPSVLVSLLDLDDAATAELCQRFYDLLANRSLSKAEALQQAQISLLRDARASGPVPPRLWASLVLIGDPR